MRPPLAGKRAAARRLAGQVVRRLEPVERVLPVKLPRPASAPGSPSARAGALQHSPEPERGRTARAPQDPAARIDAARERLRATIEPPAERDAQDG